MKRKLLLICVALLCAVGSWAQTDVTDNYVGDVTFIIGSHDWKGNCTSTAHAQTASTAGAGYFNTQSFTNEVHTFKSNTANVTNGVESWSDNAKGEGYMLGRTIVLPNGQYTLKFTALANNITNTVVKCGDTEQTFSAVQEYEEHTFNLTVTAANATYNFGIYQKEGGTANWAVMGAITLTLNSSNVHPIPNNDNTGWSGDVEVNTWSKEGNSDGTAFFTPFLQKWSASGSTLANGTYQNSYTPSESGFYRVNAWVRLIKESGGQTTYSGATLFAGTNTVNVCSDGTLYNSNKVHLGTYSAKIDATKDEAFYYGFTLSGANFNWLSFKNITIEKITLDEFAETFSSGSAVTAGTWYKFTTGSSSDAYTLSSSGNATITYTTDGTLADDAGISTTWTLHAKRNAVLAPNTTYYIKSDAAVTLTKAETPVNSSYVSGWTKVTSISELQDSPEDYFFAIFSANNTGLILKNRTNANDEKPSYATAANPLSSTEYLYEIENYDGQFALKSVLSGKYYENRSTNDQRGGIGSDGPWNYHADLATKDANCKTTLNWVNNAFVIQTANKDGENNYLGLWYADNNHSGYVNNEILAGNKPEIAKGSFIIYRIAKNGLDMTDTYITNPSFELKAAGTTQTDVVKSSDSSALSLYGWTENLNGITELRNSDWVNSTTKGTSSRFSSAVTSADGTWHYYARKGWSDSNTPEISLTSSDITLPLSGHYEISCQYLLEENYRTDNNSKGSFLTLRAKNGDEILVAEESPKSHTVNNADATYTDTSWKTLSAGFDVTSGSSTIQAVLALSPRGGVNTELHVDNFKLVYSPFATTADYTALATAISSAESHTLGFDEGEYAPYNHAEVLQTLASAKTINSGENNSQLTVRTLTSTLNNASWTANAADVDAVYNGNFAEELEGWTRTNAWGQQKIDLSGDYATAYYNQPGSLKYGSNTDYKMPLKADTYYTLKVAYRAHQSDRSTNVTVSVLKSSEGLSDKGLSWTTNTSTWTKETVTFKTGTAGDYVLTLANYDNTWMTGVSLLRATAAEIKPFLNTEITTATETRNTYSEVENPSAFQRPTSAGETFAAAIEAAQGVYDNASATASQVATAVTTLETAQATYQAAIVPPTSSQAYIVANTTANGALKVASESVTVDANAAVFFTAVTGGYVISNADDEYIYKTTGDAWTLSTTANEGDAYVITSVNPVDGGFTIQGAKGLFGTDATAAGSTVYANKAQANNGVWTITEATTVNMNVKAGKWGTFIAPFDVTIPANVTAYNATGVNGERITLSDAIGTTIPANTPVLLKNDGDAVNNTLYGVSTANADSYTVDLLTGVYTDAYIPMSDGSNSYYVLQTKDDVQAFYKVEDADFPGTPYKCYLTIPAATPVKAFLFPENPTAINAIEAAENEKTEIYNLAGQRLSKAQKGVNIINGKKVLVK